MIMSAWFSFLFLMTEKLNYAHLKKRTMANGEKCSVASKEHTVMSSENNRQRHCQPTAESEMALAAKSYHSSGEVIQDHENNDNEEEFDNNIIFAHGKDDVNFEFFSQSCNVF